METLPVRFPNKKYPQESNVTPVFNFRPVCPSLSVFRLCLVFFHFPKQHDLHSLHALQVYCFCTGLQLRGRDGILNLLVLS